MGNVGVRVYYRKCLTEEHLISASKEKDLVGRFFCKETVYGDYSGEKLYTGSKEEIDVDRITEYMLDKNKFSFLQDNTDYDNFIKRRGAFFDCIAKRREEGSVDAILNAAETDAYLDAYHSMLISSMRVLSECEDELEKAEMKRFLDIYLLIDCIKSNQEKAIYVSWIHPVMLLHAKKMIADGNLADSGGIGFMDELKRRIVSMLLTREMPKRLYSSTAIYTIDKDQCLLEGYGLMAARQIRSMSTINSIDSIRILEKVLAAWREKTKNGSSADGARLKIAFFGEFSDMYADNGENQQERQMRRKLHIEEYLNLEAVRRKYGLKDSIFEFVHFKLTGSGMTDFYQADNDNEKEKECYSLQEMGHLEGLFKNYDMAFFLDQGYYYRKAFLERKESYASAKEFNDYVGQLMTEKNRYNFRQIQLMFWMKWGFRHLGDKSGEYEFGKNLYNNIRLRPEQDSCNVYAYVSESRKVGEFDLETSNVCRGEFYYGHKMMVCHFSNQNTIDIAPLIKAKPAPQYIMFLNVWRLFKILYDDTFVMLYEHWQNLYSIDHSISIVYLLQNVWIEWDYRDLVLGSGRTDRILLKVIFDTEGMQSICPDQTDKVEKELREFIEQIFGMAFGKGGGIVKEYMQQVITEAVKSACRRTEDFLFANYLKYLYDDYCIFCDSEETDEMVVHEELSVQTRQAVHAVIKKIDTMHLRIVEHGGRYIKQDIIREYCEGISEEDFDELLVRMNKLLMKGFGKKDLLTHNVNILC